MRSRRLVDVPLAAGFALMMAGATAGAACPPRSAGYYTQAQAAAGKVTFDKICAVCHETDLSGQAGPALAGEPFAKWLAFTKITGGNLFSFITTQMPYNAPGSLSKKQYEDAFAYILSYNHYPSGEAPLNAQSVDCIALLPYPK